MTASVSVAVLGLGGAGSQIARDLVAAGADVRGYDPRVADVPSVAPRISEADTVRDADLVLSVNSGHDAQTALGNALPSLRPGTVWADLIIAAPGVKAALVTQLAGREVPVANVALLAPVPGNGLRTPMLVSGEGAERYAELLAGLGAQVEILPGPAKAAVSRTLMRSVFYKRLAASVAEAMAAASCSSWTFPPAWPPRRVICSSNCATARAGRPDDHRLPRPLHDRATGS